MDKNELEQVRKDLFTKIIYASGKHAATQLLYIAGGAFVLMIGAGLAFRAMERHLEGEVKTLRMKEKRA